MSHVHFELESPPPPYNNFNELLQFEDLTSTSSTYLPRRRPLDPPPPCFSTPSPLRIRSHDFPSFRITALTDNIADGFPILYPRHILDKHGITRADWVRFLQDLSIVARLSPEPSFVVHRRLFPYLGAVYDARFARTPLEELRALVQIWNQCAFERRKMSVSLLLGMSGKKRCALVVESL